MPDGPAGEATSTEAPRPAARPRWQRRRAPAAWRDRKVQVLSGVLVVLLVAVAVVWWGRRDSREERIRRDAGFGSLSAEQAEATREYLAGDGAPLVDLADLGDRVTAMVEDDAVGDDCGGATGDWSTLNDEAPEEGLLGLLGPLPDPTLGRLWASQVALLTEAMVLCGQDLGLGATGQLQQVAALQEPVDIRLADVGMPR